MGGSARTAEDAVTTAMSILALRCWPTTCRAWEERGGSRKLNSLTRVGSSNTSSGPSRVEHR